MVSTQLYMLSKFAQQRYTSQSIASPLTDNDGDIETSQESFSVYNTVTTKPHFKSAEADNTKQIATTNAKIPRSRFLELPLEIRLQIYSHLLPTSNIVGLLPLLYSTNFRTNYADYISTHLFFSSISVIIFF